VTKNVRHKLKKYSKKNYLKNIFFEIVTFLVTWSPYLSDQERHKLKKYIFVFEIVTFFRKE